MPARQPAMPACSRVCSRPVPSSSCRRAALAGRAGGAGGAGDRRGRRPPDGPCRGSAAALESPAADADALCPFAPPAELPAGQDPGHRLIRQGASEGHWADCTAVATAAVWSAALPPQAERPVTLRCCRRGLLQVKVAEHVLTGHKVAIKILNRKKIKQMDMEEKGGSAVC